ncbi:MAG: ATP-binding cassette domain-containing protein, partial [Desulfobacterales bacterium]
MLEAKALMVFYENMLALNNVNITCEANQIVGVFGANSAGKSTLMYTLSGIMEDIRKKEEMSGGERISVLGSIQYLGEEIMELKPSRRAKRGIILCPERRRIFKECNVLENLRIGGYLASTSQAKETLEYVFKIFPALEKLQKRIGGFLSGGEQQMLAIGRALMAQPRLLLLDEPLLGLSPLIQAVLVRATKEI